MIQYKQRPEDETTKHWLWCLRKEGGVRNDFSYAYPEPDITCYPGEHVIDSIEDKSPVRDVFTRFWVGIEETGLAECIYSDYIWAKATLDQLYEFHLKGKIIPNWVPDWSLEDNPARWEHDFRDVYIRSSKLEKLYLLDLE